MPELPEVETTRKGIGPHIQNKQISQVNIPPLRPALADPFQSGRSP
jgi:formamidopyrimidine-DNA glycosylase